MFIKQVKMGRVCISPENLVIQGKIALTSPRVCWYYTNFLPDFELYTDLPYFSK